MNGTGRSRSITFLAGEAPALERAPHIDAVFARDIRPVPADAVGVVRSSVR